jgi:hypothetical protein
LWWFFKGQGWLWISRIVDGLKKGKGIALFFEISFGQGGVNQNGE